MESELWKAIERERGKRRRRGSRAVFIVDSSAGWRRWNCRAVEASRDAAIIGATTIVEIQRYRADLALLSPVGIDHTHGATNYDQGETEVARAMVDNAERVVILADHSKIGQRSRMAYCAAERVDVLITNRKAADASGFAQLKRKLAHIIMHFTFAVDRRKSLVLETITSSIPK